MMEHYVTIHWDGRPVRVFRDKLETAYLVYHDTEGEGLSRLVTVSKTLQTEHGFSSADAHFYAVAARSWEP